MLKLLEENRGENFLNLWDKERVLKQDTKAITTKKIINKLGYMKNKNFYSAKDLIKSLKISHGVEDNFNTYNQQRSSIQNYKELLKKKQLYSLTNKYIK